VRELPVVLPRAALEEFRRDLAVEDEVAVVELDACEPETNVPSTTWGRVKGKRRGKRKE
jgi:hypothetical protein